MGSLITFIYYVLIHGIAFTFAQPDFIDHKCAYNVNYTSNSAYSTNLDTVLSSISSNTNINYGFYNFSVGQDTDTANAIALCRGDVDLDNCRSCVKNSTRKLTELCPNQEEAIGWYDFCMLRYSNRSIFHALESDPSSIIVNTNNVSNVDLFNQALAPLLNTVKGQAAGGSSARKFASGNTTTSDFVSIYVLMECTPDLSQGDCNSCLDGVIRTITDCCYGKKGVQILTPSCNLRYELQSFVNSGPSDAQPPPDPQLSPPPPGKNNSSGRTAIIVVISSVVFVILAVSVWIFFRKRKQRKPKENVENAMDDISSIESLQYDFGTIEIATDYFANTNKLGQGGFGAVYKGILQNGKEIAVKRLSMGSAQGDLEFKTEILLVAKLQHRNLVRLLGFCLDRSERLLIYEFMPNASLDQFIFDTVKRTYLDWKRRYNIIGGVARGMLYLHEDSRLRIIHRDLKASNILLDTEMNPKIADFGMARLFELDETQGNTNRIVGTYGYMAPEYAMHGLFSGKSDVFSFGILVLEIVSGQKNHSYRNGENVEDLSSYAWKNWRQGTASNLIDPTMRDSSGSMREMMRCIHIGLLCVQENENDRPTMASVVLMLNSFSLTLPVPVEPAFFMHSHSTNTESSNSKSSIGPGLPLLPKHSSKGNESSPFSESRHANLH